ncbi:SusC/RagA family TonB-linked outer membrane protein [Pedobacter steynii]|nr:SusC/RagA family TonB-linked outer membrane protein [Pedobacter steynii]
MTVSLLQVSAAGFAQRVTLSGKQLSLEQVFKEITKQTGYQVFYADKNIDAKKMLQVNFRNSALTEVMDKCLDNQVLSYIIEDKSIVIRVKEHSVLERVMSYINSIDVKGTVLDENGEPLPKATIKVKGTDHIVFTNENGVFQFTNIAENAVLQVFYLGYKTKEITGAELKSNPSVQMEVKAGELKEVSVMVNTGYQHIPKERATGSFTQINNETLNKQVGGNILDRLNGIANGVAFDANKNRPAVTVRGLSSINGPMAPLVILDNFPYEGDVNNINPNDIENISILKDAAAASIWGARAGNGVIVITTKKGAFDQPLKIGFNSNVSITARPDLFDLKQMSTNDFIDFEQRMYELGAYKSKETDKKKEELSEVIELLIAAREKKITDAQAKAGIDALRGIDSRNDAMKYLYNTAAEQQYALSFQGGNKQMTYNISGGYDRSVSSLSEKYNKVNLRAANVFKPIDKLQISTSLYYTKSNSQSGKPGYSANGIGKTIYPYTRLMDENGEAMPLHVYRKAYTDTAGMGRLLDWKYYPLEDYKHNTTETNLQSILASLGLRYELIKGLSLDLKYQYENQQIKTENLKDLESFDTRDLINQFSKLDRKTGIVTYNAPYGSQLDKSNAAVVSHNARLQADFNRTFEDHNIAALAGTEVRQISRTSGRNIIYGYDEETLRTGKTDYLNPYPSFIDGSKLYLFDGLKAEEWRNNYVSFFGNASYTYKRKYTLSGSMRKDMSNLFGVKTNEKGVPLWSVGSSWNISDESFYNLSFLPYLKLRTTYGLSGNLDSRRSAITTIRSGGTAFYTNLPQSFIENYPNPELRWEKVKMFNIGADFQLINNVLSGSVEYYHKSGVDLFGRSEMDYTTTGAGEMIKNAANMMGRGVDVELNTKIIDRTFKWTQLFNFNYNSNKVTKYLLKNAVASDLVNDGINVFTPLVGQPVFSVISLKWAGLDPLTGDPQGYLNGQVSKDYREFIGAKSKMSDLVFNGSSTPVVFGNLMNTWSWKDLALTVNITYKMGHYFRRTSVNYIELTGNKGRGHSDYANRWQKPGDEKHTDVPSFVYPVDKERDQLYAASEALVSKADHIRLQFVNLSYSLKKANWSKLPFQQVQVFTNASNLGILWRANQFGIDPEYSKTYSPAASYSLGLRADF